MKKLVLWLENFWYHYKWLTIGTAFVLIMVTIGIVQMSAKEKPDAKLVYCGSALLDGNSTEAIKSNVRGVMGKDYNGDGKKAVQLYSFTLLSDEQLEKKREEAEADGDVLIYDPTSRGDVTEQLNTLISSGEGIICLLGDYAYGPLAEKNVFASLEDILGYVPENSEDGYSVYVKNTGLAEIYPSFADLPEDTRLCICRESYASFFGNRKAISEDYENHKEIFKALLEAGKD